MTQTAWLLEWPAGDNLPTRYWNPQSGWMMDPHKACWFAREADAAAYKASSRIHGIVRPIEHVFGLQRGPTDAEKAAQGKRCSCRGSDDYCPCQNVVQSVCGALPAQSGSAATDAAQVDGDKSREDHPSPPTSGEG